MEAMQQDGVYILVQRIGTNADPDCNPDPTKLDLISIEPGDHVSKVRGDARQLIPQKVPPNEGVTIVGLVVRVEAVLIFRPALVLASASPRATEAKPEPEELPSMGPAREIGSAPV